MSNGSLYKQLITNAQMAFSNGNYDIAICHCTKAVEEKPDSYEAYSLAGNAYLLMGQPEKAEEAFRRAVKLDAINGERYFELGNSLYGQQKYSEAMSAYSCAVRKQCGQLVLKKIYYIMAKINQAERNYKDAIINFNNSLCIPGENEDRADILLRFVQIYTEQGDFSNAEDYAHQLKLAMPSILESHQLLFQVFMAQGKVMSAEEVLNDAKVTLEPNLKTNLELSFDEVIINCAKAEMNPEESETYYTFAMKGLDEIEKMSIATEKDICEVKLNKAEICVKLKKYSDALGYIKQIENKTEEELKEYVEKSWFLAASCYAQIGNYKPILPYAELLKKSENDFYNKYGYYAVAYAYKRLGEQDPSSHDIIQKEYDKAIAYYKDCSLKNPTDFMAYLYRARSYVDIGKYDRAKEIAKLLPNDAQKSLLNYIEEEKRRCGE